MARRDARVELLRRLGGRRGAGSASRSRAEGAQRESLLDDGSADRLDADALPDAGGLGVAASALGGLPDDVDPLEELDRQRGSLTFDRRGTAGMVGLEARRLDDRPPARAVSSAMRLAQVGGAAAGGLEARLGEALAHLGRGEGALLIAALSWRTVASGVFAGA